MNMMHSQSRFSVLWNGSHIFYLSPLTDSSSTTKFSIESSLHQGIRMLVRARRRTTNWVQFGEVDPLVHSGGTPAIVKKYFFHSGSESQWVFVLCRSFSIENFSPSPWYSKSTPHTWVWKRQPFWGVFPLGEPLGVLSPRPSFPPNSWKLVVLFLSWCHKSFRRVCLLVHRVGQAFPSIFVTSHLSWSAPPGPRVSSNRWK